MNLVLKEDLDNILHCDFLHWEHFRDAVFLVTGASGLVGSLAVRTLCYVNEQRNLNLRILLFVRSLEKAEQMFGHDLKKGTVTAVVGDVRNQIDLHERVDYIIHAACITESALMISRPLDTFLTSVEGTKRVLDLAERIHVKSMLYISSMEMYGITREEENPVSEEKLGYLDLMNVRTSYPEGKRAAEFLCTAYHQERGIPVKIARLSQTFGAGVSMDDKRVFAQFARSIIAGEDIILHTSGYSMGNYCYTADMLKGLFCVLEKGGDGQAYNVVNEDNTMRIRDMARMLSRELGKEDTKLVFDLPDSSLRYGYAPEVHLRLSGKKLRDLGWRPEISLLDMYKRMIHSWGYEI